MRKSGVDFIPQNYFCKWEMSIDQGATYTLSIQRNFFPIQEQLELNIIGTDKIQQVKDIELASTSPDIEWERYALINTQSLMIFARNKAKNSAL